MRRSAHRDLRMGASVVAPIKKLRQPDLQKSHIPAPRGSDFRALHAVPGCEMLLVLTPDDIKDNDEDLLRAALAAPEGDLRAFEQLVHLHRKRILADCRHLTRDANNAEDLAQEVFVKAYFGMSNFEGRSTFRHWLQRIKVHHCLSHIKRREGKEVLAVDDEMGGALEHMQVPPTAERELETEEERERIHDVLDAMPRTLSVPLVMREMDELSYEEIATSLGIGLSAVKMRIKRAREYFRRAYHEDGELPGERAAT